MRKINSILICLTLFSVICTAQEKKQNNFEDWGEKPLKVTPGEKNKAPSDAIVLFSDNLNQWQFKGEDGITWPLPKKELAGTKVTWPASKKGFAVVSGSNSIITKKSFADCQLHIEWRVPKNEDQGETLNWGNSGIYFMEHYELQVYDSYNDAHEIYYNGQAGSIYKQHKPLVNCCKKSGEWESYDIVFSAPEFNEDERVKIPAYLTVFQNGVMVQNHVKLTGPTTHEKYTEYIKHDNRLPLMIQSHGSAVEYRNIWLREL